LETALGVVPFDIQVGLGIDGRTVDCTNHELIQQNANYVVLGRETTSSEAACSLGHHYIQQSIDSEWLLILEDDAILIEPLKLIELFDKINVLKFDFPVVVSLYAGLRGIKSWRGRVKELSDFADKLYKPSTHAVAYIINSQVGNLAKKQTRLVGSPDWPTWIHKCEFYESKIPYFSSLGLDTSIISQTMPTSYMTKVSPESQKFTVALLGLLNSRKISFYGDRSIYIKFTIGPFLHRRFKLLLFRNIRK
jgi:hypothetical protein